MDGGEFAGELDQDGDFDQDLSEFSESLMEELFDTCTSITVEIDAERDDGREADSVVETQVPQSEESGLQSPSSCVRLSGLSRSLRAGSNMIFIGDEDQRAKDDNNACEDEVRDTVGPGTRRSSALDGELLAATVMRWFADEQRLMCQETAAFVREQHESLQAYVESIELLMVEQRANLQDAISKVDTVRSEDSSLFSLHKSRTVQFHTQYCGDVADVISPAAPANVAYKAAEVIQHSLMKVGSTLASKTDLGTDRGHHRRVSSYRHSYDEKALRIHLAYQNAAKKMAEKSTLVKLQERIEGASQYDRVMRFRIFGCGCLPHIVEGQRFQSFIASLIVLNAIFIGITSDVSMKRSIEAYESQSAALNSDIDLPRWATVVDYSFNVAFITEFAFRIVVLESRFCFGPDWRWNLFDTVLVILTLTEMSLLGVGFNPSFMRVLRIVRVSRSLRMLRLMRYTHLVRKLRLMTVAIINCSMMLMWAVLALLLVTFLFSVVFLNAISQYVVDALPGNEYVDDMQTYFASLFMTMVTLFMAVAGGVDWWDVMRLLLEIHIVYGLIFMLFVIITVLAVLNVINAIFVNDAMESTRTDHDLRMQGELEETRLMLERLTDIFWKMEMESSDSCSGEISDAAFVDQVEREEMKMQFALLGLHYTDGVNFFRLLDIGANKSLGIDQFVMGCLRLKGGALLIDTNIMLEDTKALVSTTSRAHKKAIETIATQVKNVSDKLSGLTREMQNHGSERSVSQNLRLRRAGML